MRFASFTESSSTPRFGIVRGDHIVDVVAAANALHRAVPATTVKAAVTSGAAMLAALEDLAVAA
jgi:5-carboxymethyl-2-hydroxymuconate isomerase